MEVNKEFDQQLKSVFNHCDSSNSGYISVNQLAELAQQYFGGGEQDIVQIIRSLGSDNTGVVSFEEFRHGICEIISHQKERADSLSSQSSDPSDSHHYDMLVPGTEKDSNTKFMNNNRAESPLIDTDNDSAIHSNSPNPGSDRSSTVPPVDNIRDGFSDADESYEGYGGLSDCDYDGDVNNPINRVNSIHQPSRSSSFRSTSSSNTSSSGSMGNNVNRSATLPFHRRNSWLRSSIRRSSFGAGKRNANAVTNQLFRESSQNSFTHSRQSSSCESGDDMFSGDLALEEDVNDLNDKVHTLQKQVSILAEGQHSSNDKYSKVKQENSNLTARILVLEEQLKEIELKSEQQLKEEQKKTKDMMSKLEREKNLQIENYTIELMRLEKEHLDLRDEVTRLKSLCDKLKLEKSNLLDRVNEKDIELSTLVDDHRKLQELSRREREEFHLERTSHTLLLNELTKEIEELRRYRQESEAVERTRSPSFYEYPSRFKELEVDVKTLKKENKALLHANEELQVTLLNKSFDDGRNLLSSGRDSSLADEFNECSKEQLMKVLKETQEDNVKLKSYIDGMLLNIMEHYPDILEVKGLFPGS